LGLRAIVDRDASGFAQELAMSRFIGVLKSPPSADIVNKDRPVG